MKTRAFAALALAAEAGFVATTGLAMAHYPGGTWCDSSTSGHRFWSNFLCDLLHVRALNGGLNSGAAVARMGMLLLIAGFLFLWLAVPELFVEFRRLGSGLRQVGLVSVVGMVLVALTPSDRFGAVHGVMVMVAGVPGFIAGALAIGGQLATRRWRLLGALGVVALLVSLLDMAIYAHHYFTSVDCSPLLPIVQRIALLLTLAWMASSGVALLRSAP